jgi:hypothetical protein
MQNQARLVGQFLVPQPGGDAAGPGHGCQRRRLDVTGPDPGGKRLAGGEGEPPFIGGLREVGIIRVRRAQLGSRRQHCRATPNPRWSCRFPVLQQPHHEPGSMCRHTALHADA